MMIYLVSRKGERVYKGHSKETALEAMYDTVQCHASRDAVVSIAEFETDIVIEDEKLLMLRASTNEDGELCIAIGLTMDDWATVAPPPMLIH